MKAFLSPALIALIATLNVVSSHAQKNRCVVRDASNLLEILNRSYSSINDPEVRLNTLQDDRANAIGIFKAYTEATFNGPATPYQNQIDGYQWEIKKNRQQISALISAFSNATAVNDLTNKQDQMNVLYGKLKQNQSDLEGKLYMRDEEMLTALANYFHSEQNELLEIMSQKLLDKFVMISLGAPDPYTATAEIPKLKKSLDLFSAGGLTVNNALGGLASFMAKRIKEELASQIFEKVKRLLSDTGPDDKFQELKVLLPTTVALLQTVAPEQYAGIVNSLKEAIEVDLNNLMVSLPKLVNAPKVQKLIVQRPEIELAFLGMQMINELNHIKSPTEIIFIIENSALISKWANDTRHKNFVNGIKLATLLVYSITEDAGDTRTFVSRNEWVNLSKNPDFYPLYIGFIIQQDKKYFKIEFDNSVTLNTVMSGAVSNAEDWFNSFSPGVTNLVGQASEIEEVLDGLKKMKADGKKISADTIASMLKSSVTFLDSALSITDRALVKLNSQTHVYAKSRIYLSYARSAIDIYSDLGMKRYYSAISRSVDVVGKVASIPDLQKAEQILLIIDAIKKTEGLFLTLDKEILAGRISQPTLSYLQTVANQIKNVCRCNTYDAAPALTLTSVAEIRILKGNLQSASLTDYISAYEELFKSNFSSAGFDYYGPLLSSSTGITTLSQLRDILASEIVRLSSKVQQNADIVKMINFLVAIAKAKDSNDFEQAIEAIALPTGSAMIKRESAFNISLNGYAGFFGGVERVYEANSNAGGVAFTVPIGVAFSTSVGAPCEGVAKPCKAHSSWSIFLSAIDIGALTSVRFKNNDQALPELTFSNVFAPGAQLIWGIPGSSFSIAAGAQLGPFLRKIDVGTASNVNTTQVTTAIDTDDPSTILTTTTVSSSQATPVLDSKAAIRFGISVLIDIPIINFYTKSKGYRK